MSENRLVVDSQDKISSLGQVREDLMGNQATLLDVAKKHREYPAKPEIIQIFNEIVKDTSLGSYLNYYEQMGKLFENITTGYINDSKEFDYVIAQELLGKIGEAQALYNKATNIINDPANKGCELFLMAKPDTAEDRKLSDKEHLYLYSEGEQYFYFTQESGKDIQKHPLIPSGDSLTKEKEEKLLTSLKKEAFDQGVKKPKSLLNFALADLVLTVTSARNHTYDVGSVAKLRNIARLNLEDGKPEMDFLVGPKGHIGIYTELLAKMLPIMNDARSSNYKLKLKKLSQNPQVKEMRQNNNEITIKFELVITNDQGGKRKNEIVEIQVKPTDNLDNIIKEKFLDNKKIIDWTDGDKLNHVALYVNGEKILLGNETEIIKINEMEQLFKLNADIINTNKALEEYRSKDIEQEIERTQKIISELESHRDEFVQERVRQSQKVPLGDYIPPDFADRQESLNTAKQLIDEYIDKIKSAIRDIMSEYSKTDLTDVEKQIASYLDDVKEINGKITNPEQSGTLKRERDINFNITVMIMKAQESTRSSRVTYSRTLEHLNEYVKSLEGGNNDFTKSRKLFAEQINAFKVHEVDGQYSKYKGDISNLLKCLRDYEQPGNVAMLVNLIDKFNDLNLDKKSALFSDLIALQEKVNKHLSKEVNAVRVNESIQKLKSRESNLEERIQGQQTTPVDILEKPVDIIAYEKIKFLNQSLKDIKTESKEDIFKRVTESTVEMLLTDDEKKLKEIINDSNSVLRDKYITLIEQKQHYDSLCKQRAVFEKSITLLRTIGEKEEADLLEASNKSLKNDAKLIENSITGTANEVKILSGQNLTLRKQISRSIRTTIGRDKSEVDSQIYKGIMDAVAQGLNIVERNHIGSIEDKITGFNNTTTEFINQVNAVDSHKTAYRFPFSSGIVDIQQYSNKWYNLAIDETEFQKNDKFIVHLRSQNDFVKLMDNMKHSAANAAELNEKISMLKELQAGLLEHLNNKNGITDLINNSTFQKLLSENRNDELLKSILKSFDKSSDFDIQNTLSLIDNKIKRFENNLSSEVKDLKAIDELLIEKKRKIASNLPSDSFSAKEKAEIFINDLLLQLRTAKISYNFCSQIALILDDIKKNKSALQGLEEVNKLLITASVHGRPPVTKDIVKGFQYDLNALKKRFDLDRASNEKMRIELRDTTYKIKSYNGISDKTEKLASKDLQTQATLINAIENYQKMVVLLKIQHDFLRTPEEIKINTDRIAKYQKALDAFKELHKNLEKHGFAYEENMSFHNIVDDKNMPNHTRDLCKQLLKQQTDHLSKSQGLFNRISSLTSTKKNDLTSDDSEKPKQH